MAYLIFRAKPNIPNLPLLFLYKFVQNEENTHPNPDWRQISRRHHEVAQTICAVRQILFCRHCYLYHLGNLSNIQFWIENIDGINLVTSRDILLSMVCVLCVRHFLLFLPKWRILQSSKLQKEYDISRALVLRHSRFNISHWLRQQLRARCNRTASIFKQQEWLFH